MSIDEIIEEHARMKWYLGFITEWVKTAQDPSRNNSESALRFAIEQMGFASTFATEGYDPGLRFAKQGQRYEMNAFEKYRALLYALDVLDAAGMLDSPAADALRDVSDAPWYALSEGERELLRNTPPGG